MAPLESKRGTARPIHSGRSLRQFRLKKNTGYSVLSIHVASPLVGDASIGGVPTTRGHPSFTCRPRWHSPVGTTVYSPRRKPWGQDPVSTHPVPEGRNSIITHAVLPTFAKIRVSPPWGSLHNVRSHSHGSRRGLIPFAPVGLVVSRRHRLHESRRWLMTLAVAIRIPHPVYLHG